MKRNTIILIIALAGLLASLIGCNSIKGSLKGWDGDLLSIMLGYESEVEGADREFEHGEIFEGESFISFVDKASFESAHELKDTFDLPDNHLEYADHSRKLLVKTYPELARVSGIRLKSSDPSILEIISVEGNEITYQTRQVGDVVLTLEVDGPVDTKVLEYPVRIYFPVDVNFYITPYWAHSIFNTRLRYKVSQIPKGVGEMIASIQDSVTVCGYCQYYDFNKSRSPFYKRDTIRLSRQDQVNRYKKNKKVLIRNITSAIREMEDRYVIGNAYVYNEATEKDTLVERPYYYSVEQVILDFNIVTPNPYIEFHYITKYTKTFEHYQDTDDDIDDGGVEDAGDMAELEVNYFTVLLNFFTSESDREQMLADLNRELAEVGYDDSLTEEEKDASIAEINKHKKKGE